MLLRIVLVGVVAVSAGCAGGGRGFKPGNRCLAPAPPTVEQQPDLAELDLERADEPLVLTVDLDGDGAPDRLVSSTNRCSRSGNCGYAVYLMRGGCGHYLGSVWAKSARGGAPGSSPVRDLVVSTSLAGSLFEEIVRYQDGEFQCVAFREKRAYVRGRLQPFPQWTPWRGCPD